MIYNELKERWWRTSSLFKLTTEKTSYFQKKKKQKQFDVVIDKVSEYVKSMPKEESKRDQWEKDGETLLDEFIEKDSILKMQYIEEKLKEGISKSTKEFIKAARDFDKKLPGEDIGQAMRNVWIINMLQAVFQDNIKFSRAIFGYSMLYPYTDNYLDNTKISKEDKKQFNNRFSLRLKGKKVLDQNRYEEKVYKLVDNIEEVFPRLEFPRVYESLLKIQEGQIKSLMQQETVTVPYDTDIMGISLEKGGASVLVDGYLIRGDLNKEEEEFCLGYGFLLQIADDLQDVKEDLKNSHMTIMSQLAGKYDLDPLANKLINFTVDFMDNHNCLKGKDNLRELIKNNSLMLILFSIILSREYFSDKYVKKIEGYLPFTIEYIEGLKDKLSRKINRKDVQNYEQNN
ncbi:hypothetical protein [Clostridium vincentii]|uniref:Uncharacterized protein n=1 Tax=Clostridium vincentii TaxID=52704 RepID=A0A2T0BAU4_9CLOT|nr:hypothetical protein [Clostridium vincentii]PRR80998.1 hypothetical protein CLVI_28360 [Clostridium vincentii]